MRFQVKENFQNLHTPNIILAEFDIQLVNIVENNAKIVIIITKVNKKSFLLI